MPNEIVVLETVQTLIADILGVERAEVLPEAMFDADLGGESIDLLDLGFRCDREFGVRVRFQDLTAHELTVGDDGALTVDALARLQERFPLLETSHWIGRRFSRPIELLSIGDIVAVVQSEMRRPVAKAG